MSDDNKRKAPAWSSLTDKEKGKSLTADLERMRARTSIEIHVTKSMEDAKINAMQFVDKGKSVKVVQVGDLIGWAVIPDFVTGDEVSRKICQRLCDVQGISTMTGKMTPVDIVWSGMSKTKQ
jgi:hypothetical protein